MKLITEAFEGQVDDLLERICAKLQLAPSQYEKAEQRYVSVAEWLGGDGSPLSKAMPNIYPQGSMKIGTTVRLKDKKEFDLDFVCQFDLKPQDFAQPVALLDVIEKRLKAHETYQGMVTRKNRCMRLTYADEFYMDILPAIPDPSRGGTCVLVPDREAGGWKESNPLGYSEWFNGRLYVVERVFKAEVETLPDQEAPDKKAPLKRAVQLIKRHRDIYFNGDKAAPISIVLTTLAGELYQNQISVIGAISDILKGMVQRIEGASPDRIVVQNPSNKAEELSERWKDDFASYNAFRSWTKKFLAKWELLQQTRGIHEVAAILKELFGEDVSTQVITEQARYVQELRKSGSLAAAGASVLISEPSTPRSVPVKPNRFYGD